ncbi:MAG: RecX family transcriptional regulator, partial [Bacteroidota bacterium]
SLFSHRIGEDVLQKALDRINEQDYFTRITSLARRKWGQLKSEEEMKRKQKTLHHLSAKGFESELIWQAINEIKSTS